LSGIIHIKKRKEKEAGCVTKKPTTYLNSGKYFMQVMLNTHCMPSSFVIYSLNILEYSGLLILNAVFSLTK